MPCPYRLVSLLLMTAGLVLLGCGRDPAKPNKAGPATENKDASASTKAPTSAPVAENKEPKEQAQETPLAHQKKDQDKTDPNQVTMLVKGMV